VVCLCVCLCLFVYHDRTSPAETDEPTEMPFVNEVNAVEPFARAIQPGLTATGTHMPYGITQCYLPSGRGDIPAVTPAEAGTRFSYDTIRDAILTCARKPT